MSAPLLAPIPENMLVQGIPQREPSGARATEPGEAQQPFDVLLAAIFAAAGTPPAPQAAIATAEHGSAPETPQVAASALPGVSTPAAATRAIATPVTAQSEFGQPVAPQSAAIAAPPDATPYPVGDASNPAPRKPGSTIAAVSSQSAAARQSGSVVPARIDHPTLHEPAPLAPPEAPGGASGTGTQPVEMAIADPARSGLPRSAPQQAEPRPVLASRAAANGIVANGIVAEGTRAPQREQTAGPNAPRDTAPLEAAAVETEVSEEAETTLPRSALDEPQGETPEEAVLPDPSDAGTDGRAASQRQGGAALPSFAQQDEGMFAELGSPAAPARASEVDREAAAPPEIAPSARIAIVNGHGLSVAPPSPAESAVPNAAPSGRASEPMHAVPVEAVASRVEWLAERGGGTARVRLDPPSLGEIEIEVRMRGGVAEVVLRTSERATHAMLTGERAAVTHILAARDVRVDEFSVVHESTPRSDATASSRDEQFPRDASSHADEGGQGDSRRHGRAPVAAMYEPSPTPARSAARSSVPDSRLDLRV
jgi:flagellar hook-length control protein FliK